MRGVGQQLFPEIEEIARYRKRAEDSGCIASAIQREDYLREIARAGLVDIAVVRTKTIAIPNDVLNEHLDKTTIQKYKKGNVGIYSITVTGKRP